MRQPVPLELLFDNPQRSHPALSPDGEQLSFIAPRDGVPNLWVAGLDGADARPLTHERDRGIGDPTDPSIAPYTWLPDGRFILYVHDPDGSENYRLYRLDPRTGEARDVTPLEDVQAQLLALSGGAPDSALVALNADDARFHDVYHLTVSTGELRKVAANPGFLCMPGIGGWLIDGELRVRGATRLAADGGLEILARERDGADFEVVLRVGLEDSLTTRALGYGADGRSLFLITSQDAPTARLVRFDLEERRVVEVLAQDDRYDLGSEYVPVVTHPETGEPQLVPLIGVRRRYVVVDRALEDDVGAAAALHDGDLTLVSRDGEDRRWIVSFTVDDGPESYYLYDRATGTGRHLFDSRPALRHCTLAKLEPLAYTARDGLRIEGYLAFPPGAERRRLPTVVAPHGGPWDRDVWECNDRVQFLATRGYLVIKPNFRGSPGYGKAHLNAGDRQWGAAMQDDLLDALDHAVAHGWADPERVAIMGGSYGGYAALMGAVRDPDVFRCAVVMYGVSSLITMLETDPPWLEGFRPQMARRVGDLETERDFLWARSPLASVDRIRIPLLIGQGANDVRVTKAESDAIVAALRERGIDHEYLVFENEGHGFVMPANNVRFHRAAERFLARHLRGDPDA